jgi:hypothetical protein
MTISSLIPTLQPTVETINTQLRFICFFVLTISMIVRTGTGNTDITHLLRPLTTNAIICAFLATLPLWFNTIRDSFWGIAVQIQQDFTGSIASTGTTLMQSLQPPDGHVNWLDVSGSVWRAVQYALAWMIVWFGAIIQLPMMFVEYIMACLCYLFLPIAVSLYAFDGTKGIAIRYVQQTIAVLSWPIGFAVVDMVGNALLNSIVGAGSGAAFVVGAATGFGPTTALVAGFVAIWLIVGSLATPLVMQALFCSGSPMSSMVGHAIQYGMGAAGMARFLGGGMPSAGAGASKPGANPSTPPSLPPSGGGGSGGGGGNPIAPTYTPASSLPALAGPMQRAALTGSPQPAALPAPASPAMAALTPGPTLSPTPAAAAGMPPRGHTQARATPTTIDMQSDPSGTLFAASVMELNQIPTAISY